MDNRPFWPAPYPQGHHVGSVSACSKRKTMEKGAVRSSYIEGTGNYSQVDRKEEVKVVSPFFNHDYPPGTKIVIASKKTDNAKAVSPSANNTSQGKEVVVSPYFRHNYPLGAKIEVASKKTDNAKAVSACANNTSQGKEIVVSPYFKHNYPPGTKIEIAWKKSDTAKAVSASVNNISQGKEIVVSPYFKHAYPPGTKIEIASKKIGYAKVVSASTNNISEVKEKEKGQEEKLEKELLVVSSYFDNSNYSKEKYKIVVKEKTIEKTLHYCTGNPSSSSSLSSVGREGEGCGRDKITHKFNPFLEAYRRKSKHNYWTPPKSRYGLLQESHYQDPWKVLVICMLLNRTTGRQARQVISDLFTLCPDARTATKVEAEEIEKIICSLGLQKKRSIMIQRFSEEYLRDDWTHVSELHGIGKYAADAYAIFCTGFWKDVQPDDHKLVLYWEDLLKSEIIGN